MKIEDYRLVGHFGVDGLVGFAGFEGFDGFEGERDRKLWFCQVKGFLVEEV